MAASRTRRAVAPEEGRIDKTKLDSYIKYLDALVGIACNSNIRVSAATGIKVTKICPPPQKAGRQIIVVTKLCPPPQGGYSDLCAVLGSLRDYLKELKGSLPR